MKRTSVRFNTKDKMTECFNALLKNPERWAMTFHIVEPIEDKDYIVFYNAKED